MWPTIKRFFTDETAFKGFARAALLGGGAFLMANPETAAIVPVWVSALVMASSGMVRAGEPNAKTKA